MDPYAILAQANFFRGLAEASRRTLADCCFPKTWRKGTEVFQEGEPGKAVYLLNRGDVKLFKTGPDGAETVIKIVRPGEVFAEAILFEQDRYPVTARALTESHAFLFLRADLLRLLAGEAFRNDFVAMLLRKQRYLADRILYLTTLDAEQRLYLFLRDHYGRGPSLRVPLGKKEVAAAIGTTPETLSRLLLRLARDGRLRWRGRQAELDPAWRPVSRVRASPRPAE